MATDDEIPERSPEELNALEELRRRERELADFIENASVGLHWVGPDGNILWANQAELDLLGYTREEYIGRSITEFHADGDVIDDILCRLKNKETLHNYEARLRCKDGSIRHVLINSNVMWDGDRFVHTRCFTRDVTERRAAEEALREGERMLAQSQRMAHVGSWELEVESSEFLTSVGRKRLKWSDESYRIFGYEPGEVEITHELFFLAVHPDDRERVKATLDEAVRESRPYQIEHRIIRPDGEERTLYEWAEIVPDSAGRPPRLSGTCQDITERKRAEEALRESERQLRTLADTIPQLAWMAEPDGHIFWYNRRWYDYTGSSPERMEGWGWQTVHDPEMLPRVVERWKASLETGEPFEMEFPLKGADGVFRWFLTRVNPLRDSRGRILRWFGTNTDVDGQRRTAAELRESSRLKDEFLATVSHELRTPLTAILGWAHLLRTGQHGEKSAAEIIEIIERNARSQTQLIDDLLDVSRIITGKLRLDIRQVDPGSIIEAAVEALGPAAEAKGVRVQKVLGTGAISVAGDPARLQQVVWNLLSNAVKFSPKGGEVQVRLERIDSHTEIAVSDTGIGIKPEFLPHVFERFRQADQTTTRHHGGLGLGLAIVRHLVELHGGTVDADSPGEGMGTTFVVRLPVVPVYQKDTLAEGVRPPAGDTLHTYECPERLDGVKVLLVDDEADTRELLKVGVGQCGAEVATAGSAREALEAIAEGRPDLLICDIGMPGEDGYELIRKVRALPAGGGGRIPAIALTAYARTDDRLRALRAGYQSHIAKPVELVELVAVMASILQRDGFE